MKTGKQIDSMPLEAALLDLLKRLYSKDRKRMTVLAQRLGWTGDGVKTLQECGNVLGVTRERLRQIESSILQRIPEQEIHMPQIDRAIQVLEEALPIPLTDAARLLYTKGISGKPFEVQGLLKICDVLGKDFNVRIEKTRYGEFLTEKDAVATMHEIIFAASRLTITSGATQAQQVIEMLRERGLDATERYITRVVSSVDDFGFAEGNWFWHKNIPHHMNRLHYITRKLLCLNSPQPIEQIRSALIHVLNWHHPTAHRGSMRYFVIPPAYVLREALATSDAFIVDGDMIKPKTPFSAEVEISKAEHIFIEILRSAPGKALDRDAFYHACVEKGIKRMSFHPLIGQSPIVESLDTGLYRLRGDGTDTNRPAS